MTSRRLRACIVIFLTLFSWAATTASARADTAEAVSPPPGARPIRVAIGFYLLNLVSVDERSETFDADLYVSLRWKDSRLAFHPEDSSHDRRMYQGDTASQRLQEIWWPDLEFVNTDTPQITNRSLIVHSDGTVDYRIGVSSTFRAALDLRRFPFDEQVLDIRLQSFEANAELVAFEADPRRAGFDPRDDYAGLMIQGVEPVIQTVDIAGWSEDFSELIIRIAVKRAPGFYIWTVFVPLSLVLLLSCTIFFVPIHGFHDRIAIALACFLACIATQFAMSFNLPKISYLTPIDRLFLVTYSCMTLAVAVSVFETAVLHRQPDRLQFTDRTASWGIPVLYALLIWLVVLP